VDASEIVAEHLRQAFVATFGAARFQVWLGKDGSREHTAAELGDASARALDGLLASPDVRAAIVRLHEEGRLAAAPDDPGPPR
jgi:hypothetical protein